MSSTNSRVIWLSIGVLVLLEGIVLWRYRPPQLVPASAPANEFSGERAMSLHSRIIPPETPHPAGSAANDQVRERIVAYLDKIGCQIEIHQSPLPSTGIVLHNILARLPNSADTGKPLVLASHYDSCPVGPGAGDAGACVVALLETVRVLRTENSLRRPVFLLLTDGEELGLEGAKAFVREHQLATTKPFVINLDARGNRGPVMMYETHDGNSVWIKDFANELAVPRITASHFTSVAAAMPNKTDFRVFKQNGWFGLNLAIIHGPGFYHAPDDTIENLDPCSVQQFGESALVLTRAIATTEDVPLRSEQDAVFFDLFGWRVVSIGPSFAWLATIFSLLILVGSCIRQRGEHWRLKCDLRVLAANLLAFAACSSAGGLIGFSLYYSGIERPTILHWTGAAQAGYAALGIGLTVPIFRLFLNHLAPNEIWTVQWSLAAIVGILVFAMAPSFAHLAIVPVTTAAITTVFHLPFYARVFMTTIAVATVWLPTITLLGVAALPYAGIVLCPVSALLIWPLSPLFGTDQYSAENRVAETASATVPRKR